MPCITAHRTQHKDSTAQHITHTPSHPTVHALSCQVEDLLAYQRSRSEEGALTARIEEAEATAAQARPQGGPGRGLLWGLRATEGKVRRACRGQRA